VYSLKNVDFEFSPGILRTELVPTTCVSYIALCVIIVEIPAKTSMIFYKNIIGAGEERFARNHSRFSGDFCFVLEFCQIN